MITFNQLTQQQYINLETFRKNGIGVKTPVWFVQDDNTIYVRTIANSGKVKRICSHGRVNIAPCTSDGTLVGEWIDVNAREVTDRAIYQKVDQLLDKKYGLMKRMFAMASALQGRKYTILEIELK
jgi:PPOX class probable F420-dependent enzyme